MKLSGNRNSSPYFPLSREVCQCLSPPDFTLCLWFLQAVVVKSQGWVLCSFRLVQVELSRVQSHQGPAQKHVMGLQAWDLQDLGDAPFSVACQLLPFLPLQLQEETALKTAAFPSLFVLLKPLVAGHRDGKWSSVWFRQWCWRRLSSCFLLKGSRLNPLISFPVDYQELVCVLPSPVSWASSAFPKICQAFESCEALMTKPRSCIWVLMGKIQASGYFFICGLLLKLRAVFSFMLSEVTSRRNNVGLCVSMYQFP